MRVLVRINAINSIDIHPAHTLPPHPSIDECFQADRTKAEETEDHPIINHRPFRRDERGKHTSNHQHPFDTLAGRPDTGRKERTLKVIRKAVLPEAARAHPSESDRMAALDSKITSSTDSHCPDCSPFLNWRENEIESEQERAVVYRSLVATMKFQSALDESLEAKAVKLLECVVRNNRDSADAFLSSFASVFDESSIKFVQSIVVLTSSPNKAIIKSAMTMIETVFEWCSTKILLALVKADLITQVITTLNPLSFSFAEVEDIHSNLMSSITCSLWLSTPYSLGLLEIKDRNEQQAVNETILQQVVIPSEKYIWHLCVNRFSIIEGDLASGFMHLLARLLEICPYHQPTLDFVLHMPISLTIPSCLAFIDDNNTFGKFLGRMVDIHRERNRQGGNERPMWKTGHRMLRMEGIEDVMEEKLRNDTTFNRHQHNHTHSQPHHLHSSLHPLSLSFTAFQDLPVTLVHIVPNPLSLTTPRARRHLDIKRLHEPHAVRMEFRQQVLCRSAEWIRRWCSVAESIVLVDINSKMRLPSFTTIRIRHFPNQLLLSFEPCPSFSLLRPVNRRQNPTSRF
ncbi:hypothetical protein BLNAU_12384 [Blattamonas nauphoetae]|uniref:Uncharacterized protein n=1 Tax=Blattamonas nauphoetae TaxID=2049346 RepID=A0ABQ9XR99_9EUKA|nr:hypothetical protein BLNAU_12384 [Blattamonas nauphoetae]